jgi:HTH-type transcriptional regulator / antitoxin HigA
VASTVKRARHGSDRRRYFELVQRFPLRPLRSDKELAAAIKVIDSLIVRGDLDAGERDYLDILTDVVEKYEAEEEPMPAVSDAVMLRHLLEARGITQAQLAVDVGILMSTISHVLNNKRRLTRNQVGILSKYFGVPPAVFQS